MAIVFDRGMSRLAVAAIILLGSFQMGLGTNWDIDWHTTVGRESFWIPPHFVIYSGTALIFLGAALGVLVERGWLNSDDRSDPRTPLDRRSASGMWVAIGGAWLLAAVVFGAILAVEGLIAPAALRQPMQERLPMIQVTIR